MDKLRVIPFGTSSGRPTATRHVSGLALDAGSDWVLVDCGEGTQQQVMRSPIKLSRLRAVLLTHLHGDHVLGLPGLLGTLAMEGRAAPLRVVAPAGVRRWLDTMLDLPILGLTFDLDVTELPAGDAADPASASAAAPAVELGTIAGFSVRADRLVHRVPSYGYRFVEPDRPGALDLDRAVALGLDAGPDLGRLRRGETVRGVRPDQVIGPPRPGRVVALLGDTTRAAASVRLAADADLLVHECTYAAADHELCDRWTHSCTADVAAVAAEARARHVLLTHFSARYADPERLVREVRCRLPAGSTATVHAAVENAPVDIPRP